MWTWLAIKALVSGIIVAAVSEIADLHEVAKALEPVLGEYEGAKLAWRPQVMVDVNESDAGTLLKLIDTLDEDDDVQTVWGNYDVSDEIMEKLG